MHGGAQDVSVAACWKDHVQKFFSGSDGSTKDTSVRVEIGLGHCHVDVNIGAIRNAAITARTWYRPVAASASP
ncbi:hypothetical protein [Nannocystis radixulma]|uniref:hypothetical protein n=1 Tax=Nannocystis radixulma TaxID=2995305 RepID=UPI00232C5472|nr:hypothetical protein [Nannocystis radixulma]